MIYYEANRTNPQGGIYHQDNVNLGFRQHLHDSFEWICVRRGEVEILLDDRAFTVREGQGILIFPNQIHQARTQTESETLLCVFQTSLIGEFYRTVKGSVPQNPVFCVTEDRLLSLRSADASRYRLKSGLYEMIACFEEQCGGYTKRNSKPAEHIGRILTFIAEHHTESITMQDAAREVGYDYHYLSNLLQKGLHTTFRTLLNEYRISHARQLLLSGHESVASIAGECGYESLCSFNRNFKEQTGMTPTEYREKKY